MTERSIESWADGLYVREYVREMFEVEMIAINIYIVRALETAADHELDGIYNVGTGDAYSFNTVVEMLNDELGTDIDPEYVANPIPEDVYVHDTCADASKLCEATGWESHVPFDEGVAQVCAPY